MQKTDGRVETWNGHPIRFVGHNGEWWAVAKDVAEALGYEHPENAVTQHCKNTMKKRVKADDVIPRTREAHIRQDICDVATGYPTSRARKTQDMTIIPEKDIYRLIFRSRLPEAEAFQDWVFDIIRELRKSLGLSEYEAFRLMDKEHQKAAMRRLFESLREPVKVDYIKANTIADKAVSTMHGCPKLIKKAAMDEALLRDREAVLTDTVELMALNERFSLGLSVSERVYRKYCVPSENRAAV
jgi:prophage antirepressor-like protein